MKIIGFTGGMGVGKSTAIDIANRTMRAYGQWSDLVKFAQPLYNMQEDIYERIKSVYKRPETFVKDRKLLQWLGTDWGRGTISETLWIDLWKAAVIENARKDPNALILCDDVRFDNEAEAVRALGGKVIKIVCPSATDRITTANGLPNHSSEAGVSGHLIDQVIENTGSLDDYATQIRNLVKNYVGAGHALY